MPHVSLDYADGRYTLHEITVDEARKHGGHLVQESVLEAYRAHCAQDAVFQTLFRVLDNQRVQDDEECSHPGCKGKIRARVCDECRST